MAFWPADGVEDDAPLLSAMVESKDRRGHVKL
jgi:hypothetical protein